MQEYSLVISIFGWSAVNKLTGKSLSGDYSELPGIVSSELMKLVKPSTNSLCIACTVRIPNSSVFHDWFMRQPVLTHTPL